MTRSLSPLGFPFALLLAAAATACDPAPDENADTDDSATDGSDGSTTDPDTGEETSGSSSGGEGECVVLEQDDVAGDTTLPAGCYDVPFLLNIDGTLTVEAGAELHFDTLAGLFILTGGELVAQGSADAPVVFEPAATSWMGLEFLGAASAGNLLDHTDLRGVDGDAIRLSASALTVTNSNVADNDGLGLLVSEDSDVSVSASTFSGNTAPIELGLEQVANLGGDNTLTGNDDDVVLVRRGTLASDATWVAQGVPLALDGTFDISGDLVLSEGVNISMPLDAAIYVGTEGSLAAEGSADAPVVFGGQEDQPGYWTGISFESKATANSLGFAVVENAGSSQWNGNNITNAAVWLTEESKVIIHDTTIRGSGGAAVMALSGSDLTGFANNTIENNEESLVFTPNLPDALDGSNTFSNNGDDVILIYDSFSEDAQLADHTWPDAGIPYRVMEPIGATGDWVVAPGVTIEVAQDVAIAVESTGSINAVGTADAPIHFVGVEALQGYWMGIEIHSVSASNVFENVELLNAGSEGFNGSDDSDGALFIGGFGGDGSATIRNSTVADSGGYGISVWNDSTLLDCGSVTFSGNAKADVYVNPDGGSSAC